MDDSIKISTEKPACFDRLAAVFPIVDRWEQNLVITYGGVIHCKKGEIPPSCLIHELVHVDQQKNMDPDVFVDRYIAEPDFRFQMELEAYQAEAKWIRENMKDAGVMMKYLEWMWKMMSSDLYGNMITYEEAKKLI